MEPKQLAETIIQILEEKKAYDIECLPVDEQTQLADYFIIASGSSVTHVKSLEGELTEKLKKLDRLPISVEGRDSGNWILLDYGSCVVHLFREKERQFYALDQLWREGRRPPMEREEADTE